MQLQKPPGDEEAQKKTEEEEEKLPYPKGVFLIATNEFCERFCYYGMRAVLSLYLTEYLLYSESEATVIYHTFIMLAYFFPLFGAMIADGFLGKYKTMVYISMIYAVGGVVLSLAAVTPLGLPHRELSLLGLFCIAMGTGGIKPSVLPLGGDQFVLPQQEALLTRYFSLFYFSVNLGSLLSTVITPILREDVHCFEEDTCFPFAFGLPSVLMLIAIVIIILGRPLIKVNPPEGNLLYKVGSCICYSIKASFRSNKQKAEHWLDRSREMYGEKLVGDLKKTFKVLVVFLPMPIFWALVDQIGSTWTFQARRMDGNIGFYTILPDQMQFLNSLFYLIWIPTSEYVLYPAFRKLGILTTPLQKITCGGVITALAFVSSASVSLALETTYPVLPSGGNGQIRIYNTLPCDVDVTTDLSSSGGFFLARGDCYRNVDVEVADSATYSFFLTSSCANFSGQFLVEEEKAVGCYFEDSGEVCFEDDVSKHERGLPKIRNLINSHGLNYNISYHINGEQELLLNSSDKSLHSLDPGTYQIRINNNDFEYSFYLGGVYTILAIPSTNTDFEIFVIEVTASNSVHMLWLLPQYVLLTLGELLFSIPGVDFAYTQAPLSMKSLVASCWLLTTAVGNLIVIIIEAISIFELASYNSFLYAVMMLLAMVVFAVLAMRYKYVEIGTTHFSREGGEDEKLTLSVSVGR